MSTTTQNDNELFGIDSINDGGITLNCGLDLSFSNLAHLLSELSDSVHRRDINVEELGLTPKQSDKLGLSLHQSSELFSFLAKYNA